MLTPLGIRTVPVSTLFVQRATVLFYDKYIYHMNNRDVLKLTQIQICTKLIYAQIQGFSVRRSKADDMSLKVSI